MQQLSPIPDRLPPLCRSHSVSARFLESLPQRCVIKLQATPLIQTVHYHRTPLAPRLGPTALFTLTPLGCLRSFLAQLVHIHDPKLTLTAAATAPTHRQQQRSTPLTSALHAAQKTTSHFSHRLAPGSAPTPTPSACGRFLRGHGNHEKHHTRHHRQGFSGASGFLWVMLAVAHCCPLLPRLSRWLESFRCPDSPTSL